MRPIARQGVDETSTDPDSKSSGSREAQSQDGAETDMQAGDDRLSHLVRRFMDPPVASRFLRLVKDKIEYAPRQHVQSLRRVQHLSLLELLNIDIKGAKGLGSPTSSAPTDTDGDSHSTDGSSGGQAGSSSSDLRQTSNTFGSDSQGENRNGQNDESNSGSSNPTENLTTESRPTSQRTRLRCPFHALFPDIFCASQDTKFKSCQGPGWPSMQYLK